jgi:hypothetical protein
VNTDVLKFQFDHINVARWGEIYNDEIKDLPYKDIIAKANSVMEHYDSLDRTVYAVDSKFHKHARQWLADMSWLDVPELTQVPRLPNKYGAKLACLAINCLTCAPASNNEIAVVPNPQRLKQDLEDINPDRVQWATDALCENYSASGTSDFSILNQLADRNPAMYHMSRLVGVTVDAQFEAPYLYGFGQTGAAMVFLSLRSLVEADYLQESFQL